MILIDFFDPVERYRKKCEKFAKSGKCPDELLKYYQKTLPGSDTPIKDCTIVSIDFETTGVESRTDYVLSMGGLEIINNSIEFSTSFHFFVNNSKYIKKDSAIINHITPEQLIDGKDPHVAMLDLLDIIAGKIILVHCQYIEVNFIKKELKLGEHSPLPFLTLDTMAIERSLNHKRMPEDVSLSGIRERRGFPPYEAHNALMDSVATAEVFLAQLKDLFGNSTPVLSTVYSRSR